VGNLTKVPFAASFATIGLDAENRQVAFCTNMATDSASCPNAVGAGRTLYVYDGLGNRVQRIDASGNATTYVYDASGNLAAEYGATSLAAGTQYLTVDALGSTRLAMGAQTERHDYDPYGYEVEAGGWRTGTLGYGTDTVRQKFTGQERDGESGLDYFNARYYSAAQGRFLSVDPGNAGANPADPQSWNGYAYVSNNPLTFTDPSGLGFWSDFGNFFLKVGMNVLTAGLGNLFGGGGGLPGGLPGGGGPCGDFLPCGSGGFGVSFEPADKCPNGDCAPSGGGGGGVDIDPRVLDLGVRFTANAFLFTTEGRPSRNWKHTAGCFARGLAVGAGGALVVAGAAAGAAALGVPAAVVTGGLAVVGVAGGTITLVSGINDVRSGNYAGVAYGAGSLVGGFAAGGTVGRAVGNSIKPPASPGWSFFRDIRNLYNPRLGSVSDWLGTGPDTGAAAGASGFGAGLIAFLRGGC